VSRRKENPKTTGNKPDLVARERRRKMLESGMKPSEVAKIEGVSPPVIYRTRNILGIPPATEYQPRFSAEDRQAIIDMSNDGSPVKEIAALMGAKPTTIEKVILTARKKGG
jgi:DNA invertase Pin-like site-specific DNA recombinase